MLSQKGAGWLVLGTCAVVGMLLGTSLPLLAPIALPIDPITVTPSAHAPEAVSIVRVERLTPPPPDPDVGPPSRPPTSPSCPEGWRLVGAAVVRGLPHRSVAALHGPAGASVLSIGEVWLGRTLAALEPDHAVFEDGSICRLGPESERDPAPPGAAPAARTPGLVDRALFERTQTPEAMRAALGPVRLIQNGESIRLFGVRSGSPLAELGLANGDRLVAVEGRPPTPDDALALYARFARGEPIALTIERGSERLERVFRLGP